MEHTGTIVDTVSTISRLIIQYHKGSHLHLMTQNLVKFFNEEDGVVKGYDWNPTTVKKFSNTMETNYATDWLFDRGIDFIEEKRNSNKSFALMLSIPGTPT